MGGQIQLLNCNCLDVIDDIISTSINPIIVTDPPFNIGYKYRKYSDNMPESEYLDMMKTLFEKCPHVVIHYPEALYKIALHNGKIPERVISWVYNSNTAKQHRDIAFFGVKPDMSKVRQPYKNLKDKRIIERMKNGCTGAKLYDWWNVNQVKNVSKNKTQHPCQMPLEVMENIVGILPDNVTIIDPFMGSGTTGMACMKYNKRFIGIEMDEEYFNISKERILNKD